MGKREEQSVREERDREERSLVYFLLFADVLTNYVFFFFLGDESTFCSLVLSSLIFISLWCSMVNDCKSRPLL